MAGHRGLGTSTRLIAFLVGLLVALVVSGPARALPAFAAQTGQPCQTCHVGGFGPQLTPYGRNFKIHGYTQRATKFNVPLSAMVEASYVRTARDQPPPPHYSANDNVTIDQISLFLAGGLGSHLGAFVQGTYDGVARSFAWDNLDVRANIATQLAGHDVVLGASLNNNPTLSDPFNTLPAWGFPYTGSALAPSPSASPLLDGGLAQTTLGVTGYAWIDNALYLEAGAYGSPHASTLRHLGVDPTSPGTIQGWAPYGRVAYQASLAGGTAEFGAFAMKTRIHPGLDRSISLTDRYTDVGVDASFYRALTNGDVVTANARYIHERQSLRATCALAEAGAGCVGNTLDDLRFDISYYWRNRIGGTVQIFNATGGANPLTFADSRTFKPNSTGVTLQLDGTPFGDRPQPMRRVNMRVGLQYTIYTRFDGASKNFDGAGANASDNNTLRLFTWFAF